MSKRSSDFWFSMLVGMYLMYWLGLFPVILVRDGMIRDAIQAGAAYHDPQTGELRFGCTGGMR